MNLGGRSAERALLLLPIALAVATWFGFLADRAPGTPAARDGFPLDDAWIHFVYARSLVDEGGFNYNAGVPETGMTSPLWVVLAAGAHAVVGERPRAHDASGRAGSAVETAPSAHTRDAALARNPAWRVVIGAKILSLLCGLAGVVVLYALARALGEGRAVALAVACLAALDPSMTFARASGMEVPLFIALVLGALLAAIRTRPILAGLAAGLSVVARPEGVVVLPIVVALLARREVFRRPHALRTLALASLLAILPALLYALFCLSATGAPLPNTFYAKFTPRNPISGGTLETIAFGWRHYVAGNLPYFALGVGAILAVAGGVRAASARNTAALLTLAAGPILFVSALATRGFAPGHFFYWERWLIPAFPFFFLAMAIGLGAFRDAAAAIAARGDNARARGLAGAALFAALAALALWPLPQALRERSHLYAWNCQNIEEMNVALGRWIDATLPRGTAVAVNDAGALRYFGNRPTVDLLGLNDHAILRRDPSLGVRPLADRGVEYFVIFPSWFRDLGRAIRLAPVHEVRSPHYTICEGEQDLMVVYKWERP
ncbi:MAG: glycosyltransferase family 39 protein [bacterium]